MKKQLLIHAVILLSCVFPAVYGAPADKPAGNISEGTCFSACFRSPHYFWLNLERLGERIGNRDASVVIGGFNFNQPISAAGNLLMVRHCLQGSAFPGIPPSTPLARLNQEFLAAQLSLALAGDDASPAARNALNGQLQCYGGMTGFKPAVLSNGATLTHFSTLGELFEQATSAIRENRAEDMDALAALFDLLNGNDSSGNCHTASKTVIHVPRDYATIQEAVDAAKPGDVIKVGKGAFKGASVNKAVTLIGEGSNTRITSGVGVPRVLTDPGFPAFAFVGFLVSFGGSGATISNFKIELTPAPVIPNPILAIGVHVRHADDVTVIHNEVVGPGAPPALSTYAGVYLLGANRCTVAHNKLEGTYNGVGLFSDPFINTPTTKNEVAHNRMVNMRIGIDVREHRMNPAAGLGPEQPVQQNKVSYNSVQGNIGLNLFDQTGTLRDFISDNRFTHNDFRQCTTPLQENVPGMAGKNYFFMNLGL
jgi:hypothetical protein